MIKTTSTRSLPVIALLLLGLTSCASTGSDPQADDTAGTQYIVYEVQPGDQLGSIAERFTGKFEQWTVIADYNGITDPRTLAAGQTLSIPTAILKPIETLPAELEVDSQVSDATSIGSNSSTPISVTTGSGVSIAGRTAANTEDTSDIKIAPVEINRSFVLEPMDVPLDVDATNPGDDSLAPKIRVSGTYYPKGVYEEAANDARLMQRAAPGTIFSLESKVNAWYKVITDDGIGYIRQSDGVLVD